MTVNHSNHVDKELCFVYTIFPAVAVARNVAHMVFLVIFVIVFKFCLFVLSAGRASSHICCDVLAHAIPEEFLLHPRLGSLNPLVPGRGKVMVESHSLLFYPSGINKSISKLSDLWWYSSPPIRQNSSLANQYTGIISFRQRKQIWL